jgi:hypothetical protein
MDALVKPAMTGASDGKIVAAGDLGVYILSFSDERCGGMCKSPHGAASVSGQGPEFESSGDHLHRGQITRDGRDVNRGFSRRRSAIRVRAGAARDGRVDRGADGGSRRRR